MPVTCITPGCHDEDAHDINSATGLCGMCSRTSSRVLSLSWLLQIPASTTEESTANAFGPVLNQRLTLPLLVDNTDTLHYRRTALGDAVAELLEEAQRLREKVAQLEGQLGQDG